MRSSWPFVFGFLSPRKKYTKLAVQENTSVRRPNTHTHTHKLPSVDQGGREGPQQQLPSGSMTVIRPSACLHSISEISGLFFRLAYAPLLLLLMKEFSNSKILTKKIRKKVTALITPKRPLGR
jgi:hypothetical protein